MGRQNTRAGMTRSNGGASCFRAFEQEFDYVHRTLLRYGVAVSDAEDLVQDVFLVTWRRWADFDPGRPLRPWLAGIAFKVASEHLKRRRRWEPRAWLDLPDQAPGGEELLAASRARVLALRGLQALGEQQRRLIVLHDLDGVSMREIARLFGVPLFTGYSRLRAARRAFSDVVDRHLRQAPVPSDADALSGAAALLALEKTPPAAPADTRRRALTRLRGLVLLVPGSTPAPRPIGRAVFRGQALALGAAALVLTAGVVTVARGSGAAQPPTSGENGPQPSVSAGRVPAIRAALAALSASGDGAIMFPARSGADSARPDRRSSLARGLIGYWTFDEAGSGRIRDHSGNDNHCTLQLTRSMSRAGEGSADTRNLVPGISGAALELDGRGFLSCLRPEPLAQLRTEITISLWAQPLRRTGRQVLIDRQMGTLADRYFSIALSDGSVELTSHAWQSVTRRQLPAATGLWIHIAAVHKDDGRTQLFVDGVLVGRSNRSRRAHLGGGSSLLTLGGSVDRADPGDPGSLFEGALDEVQVYNRALEPSELRALAARAVPRRAGREAASDNIASIHQ